jgi:hypothetical protein
VDDFRWADASGLSGVGCAALTVDGAKPGAFTGSPAQTGSDRLSNSSAGSTGDLVSFGFSAIIFSPGKIVAVVLSPAKGSTELIVQNRLIVADLIKNSCVETGCGLVIIGVSSGGHDIMLLLD